MKPTRLDDVCWYELNAKNYEQTCLLRNQIMMFMMPGL
jgi:hypothetical protein